MATPCPAVPRTVQDPHIKPKWFELCRLYAAVEPGCLHLHSWDGPRPSVTCISAHLHDPATNLCRSKDGHPGFSPLAVMKYRARVGESSGLTTSCRGQLSRDARALIRAVWSPVSKFCRSKFLSSPFMQGQFQLHFNPVQAPCQQQSQEPVHMLQLAEADFTCALDINLLSCSSWMWLACSKARCRNLSGRNSLRSKRQQHSTWSPGMKETVLTLVTLVGSI